MIKPMLHLVNRIYSEISLISNSVLLRNYKIYKCLLLLLLFSVSVCSFLFNLKYFVLKLRHVIDLSLHKIRGPSSTLKPLRSFSTGFLAAC